MATPEQESANKAAQEKLNARIDELKGFVGKTFKQKDGGDLPSATYTILNYEGIGTLAGGVKAHLFRVERKNPGAIYTPPATEFLANHEEIEVQETATAEVI